MRNIGNVKKDSRVRAVASGALTDGTSVIVNADGTVGVVVETSQTQAAGTATVFESPASGGLFVMDAVYDSTNNKVVVVYKDGNNSSYGTAVVGTVSGTSISFGSPVVFRSALLYSGSNETTHATHIGGKIVICYADSGNSGHGYAIVGTVSGTSISFGTQVVFNSAATFEGAVVCTDTTNNKVIVAYRDEGNSNYGTAKVGTLSGTSISFGSATIFRSATVQALSIGFNPSAGVAVVGYRQPPYGGADANVLTVSGTSISAGSNSTFNAGSTTNINVLYDSNAQKTVIIYVDDNNSNKGTGIVGTISGTDITFGSEVIFNDAITSQLGATFDSNINKVVIAYADSNSQSNFTTGIVSGTSITFGQTETQFYDDGSGNIHFYARLCFDTSTNKCIVAFRDNGGTGYGAVLTAGATITNLTSENFIGFSDGVFSDTDSAVINTANTIDRNQSGLTAGQTYFVQADGTLGTTAASPSVTAGTAISATELIVKG